MSRHIARRWYYVRQARQAGHIQLLHIDGDKYQLADLGTKNVPAAELLYKLSIIETSIIEEGLIVAKPVKLLLLSLLTLVPWHNRRGVLGIRVESRERVTFAPSLMKRFHDLQQFHSLGLVE